MPKAASSEEAVQRVRGSKPKCMSNIERIGVVWPEAGMTQEEMKLPNERDSRDLQGSCLSITSESIALAGSRIFKLKPPKPLCFLIHSHQALTFSSLQTHDLALLYFYKRFCLLPEKLRPVRRKKKIPAPPTN